VNLKLQVNYKINKMELNMKSLLLMVLLSIFSSTAFSSMHKDEVVYKHGDIELKGFVFWDDAFDEERPGILVGHEKWGINDHALLRAEMLAESGYVAFVPDMYGDAANTRKIEEANEWLKDLTDDKNIWRERITLGLNSLLSHPRVNKDKIAAIGYSLGASSVLELAYTGADIKGVISVHGSLPVATAKEAQDIKAKVLVLNGGSDNLMSYGFEKVNTFSKVLSNAEISWELNVYGGAKNGFTDPYADSYGLNDTSYNIDADQRSWLRILAFFSELFEDDLSF